MREISPSDNDYPERKLSGTLASTSITSSFESHGRSNSTSSMPSVSLTPFISSGRHRLLPQIPTHIRRSSSPRFLPTIPPLSLETTSIQSNFSLPNWNLEQRSITTGRRLPQTPIHTNFTRSIDDKNNATTRQQYSATVDENDDDNINSGNITGNIGDNEWPSPTIIQRKFSELRKIPPNDNNSSSTLFEHITCGTSFRSLQRSSFLKQQQYRHSKLQPQQQKQQRGKFSQPQYSLDQSSGTSTSTNAYSQSSSLSPSVEQV